MHQNTGNHYKMSSSVTERTRKKEELDKLLNKIQNYRDRVTLRERHLTTLAKMANSGYTIFWEDHENTIDSYQEDIQELLDLGQEFYELAELLRE